VIGRHRASDDHEDGHQERGDEEGKGFGEPQADDGDEDAQAVLGGAAVRVGEGGEGEEGGDQAGE
jgi:hypothetical protein